MLELIDLGCSEHRSCQVIIDGSEAKLIADILYSLPVCGGRRTYICEHGHTHEVSLTGPIVTGENLSSVPADVRNYTDFQ